MPPAMVIEIDEMDDAKRTTFLANVLNETYMQEWNELYIQIMKFVKLMYIEIIKLMNDEE